MCVCVFLLNEYKHKCIDTHAYHIVSWIMQSSEERWYTSNNNV